MRRSFDCSGLCCGVLMCVCIVTLLHAILHTICWLLLCLIRFEKSEKPHDIRENQNYQNAETCLAVKRSRVRAPLSPLKNTASDQCFQKRCFFRYCHLHTIYTQSLLLQLRHFCDQLGNILVYVDAGSSGVVCMTNDLLEILRAHTCA